MECKNSSKSLQYKIEIGKPFFVFGYKFILKSNNKLIFYSKHKNMKLEILAFTRDFFHFNNTFINSNEETLQSTCCLCGRVLYLKNKKLYLVGTLDGNGKMSLNTLLD